MIDALVRESFSLDGESARFLGRVLVLFGLHWTAFMAQQGIGWVLLPTNDFIVHEPEVWLGQPS